MSVFKDVGKIVIPSNTSRTIYWEVTNLSEIINYAFSVSLESPSFRFKTETLKIKLILNFSQIFFLFQVVLADDTSCVTSILHKKGIQKADNSLYGVMDVETNVGIFPQPLGDLNSISAYSTHVTFFVEFSLPEENVESQKCLPTVPVESSKCSSPPCKECGRVEKKGQDILTKNLKELYVGELHCDFIINVRERKFNVHKAILSTQSKVFAAMMEHDMVEKKRNEVDINDCDPDAFHEFLLYLYSGKVEASSDESVVDLYKIAHKYNVEDLKEECVKYMKNNLSVDMFCKFIRLAVYHEETELLKLSKEYFTSNVKEILSSTNWQEFLSENADNAIFGNELYLLLYPKE